MTGRRAAIAAYVALGIVWGLNFVFMQAAAPYISAAQTTTLRLALGAVPVLALALATRSVSLSHLRDAHHFAVQAVLAAGFYYFAYAAGTYRLDSGIAGALSGSIPLFASVIAIGVFRTERLTRRTAVGVLLGALGVLVIARPWDAGGIDAIGVGWMLAGSASLGASFGYARRFISPLGIPSVAAAAYQMLLAALGMALLVDLHGITAIAADTRVLLAVVLGLGLLGTGCAFVFYYAAVNGLGAVTASTATYIPPVIALVIGVVVVGESLHPLSVLGATLILGAAVMMQARPRDSRQSA